MRSTYLAAGAFAVGCSLAWAGSFWRDKPYTDWSPDEVKKILSNSPWTQQVSIMLGGPSMGDTGGRGGRGGRGGGGGGMDAGGAEGGMGGAGGMQGGGMGGPGGGGGGGRRGGGDMGAGSGSPALHASLCWLTALPVREALARQSGKSLRPETNKFYILAVSGLRGGRGPSDVLDRLKSATRLNRKGKDPLAPVNIQRNETGSVLIFYFPADDPITLDDGAVEFVTRLGPLEVKHKFKLKDMVFDGKLEL